jgi:hypothetical protein
VNESRMTCFYAYLKVEIIVNVAKKY